MTVVSSATEEEYCFLSFFFDYSRSSLGWKFSYQETYKQDLSKKQEFARHRLMGLKSMGFWCTASTG